MATPVMMPRQGQSVESCLFSTWHVSKGAEVKKGDLLFSYETDKAAFDGESPADGTLLETFAAPGDVIPVLENIAVIGIPGDNIDEFRPGGVSTEEDENIHKDTAGGKIEEAGVKSSAAAMKPDDRIRISPRARKTAAELKVPPGGIPASGPEGRILQRDILKKAAGMAKATPLARSIAYSERIDLPVEGSGQRGKITSADLKGNRASRTDADYEEKPLSNVRRIIAQKMHESLRTTAQLTLHASADARKIMELRKRYKSESEISGSANVTLNDLVCFAVIKALANHPGMNAHFTGDAIRIFKSVHLGFAVDTTRGLVVPTVRNADRLDLMTLSVTLKELAARSQAGDIDPGLLTGATFTVTNLGALGVEMFTPVLNPPQVGILGINTIRYEPADIGDGVIGFIPKIGLSLTFDHRAVDGAPAALFLRETINMISEFNIH